MEASMDPPPMGTGIKVLIGFLIFHLLIVITQTVALFVYDWMAQNKLQEPRFLADEAVVQSNRAICAAHAVVMLPLNCLALWGLGRHQFYGMICSWMLLGTCLYWPVNFVASRFTYASAGIRHVKLNSADLGICLFVFTFACWASWMLTQAPQLTYHLKQRQERSMSATRSKRD
jgi:hypothetical protein